MPPASAASGRAIARARAMSLAAPRHWAPGVGLVAPKSAMAIAAAIRFAEVRVAARMAVASAPHRLPMISCSTDSIAARTAVRGWARARGSSRSVCGSDVPMHIHRHTDVHVQPTAGVHACRRASRVRPQCRCFASRLLRSATVRACGDVLAPLGGPHRAIVAAERPGTCTERPPPLRRPMATMSGEFAAVAAAVKFTFLHVEFESGRSRWR